MIEFLARYDFLSDTLAYIGHGASGPAITSGTATLSGGCLLDRKQTVKQGGELFRLQSRDNILRTRCS